jgi:hypothetical protein
MAGKKTLFCFLFLTLRWQWQAAGWPVGFETSNSADRKRKSWNTFFTSESATTTHRTYLQTHTRSRRSRDAHDREKDVFTMGKKSKDAAKRETRQIKKNRRVGEEVTFDSLGKLMVGIVLGVNDGHSLGAQASFARFIEAEYEWIKMGRKLNNDLRDHEKVRAVFVAEWDALSDAERAEWATAPPSCTSTSADDAPATEPAASTTTATTAGAGPVEAESATPRWPAFIESEITSLHLSSKAWAESELSVDFFRMSAAEGDTMLRMTADCGHAESMLALGMHLIWSNVSGSSGRVKGIGWVAKAADAKLLDKAQFLYGLLIVAGEHTVNAPGGEEENPFLTAGRMIRKAAKQGLQEAQWELGEMFRKGLFCKVHMEFARKYIKRAAKQGCPEAVARMKDLRGCFYCGAALACSLCLKANYCDSMCSGLHWREGGDVAECEGDAPHKKTCPRKHTCIHLISALSLRRRLSVGFERRDRTRLLFRRNISYSVP